jgi:hypothetical protein
MRQQWMNDLHDRMEHYEKKAPGGLLGDIKREMSARGIRPLSVSSPEKHRTVWLKRFAAVASIAVLSLMAWHLTPDREKYNPQRAHLSTDDVNSDENILQALLPLLTQKYPTSKALPRETLHRFIASDMPVEEISQVVEETSVDTLPQDERKVEHTAHISKESDVVDAPLFASSRHSKNSGFSLGIGFTSSAADNQQQRTWLNMESIAFSPNDAENEQRPDIMEPSFLSAQNNVENTHYRQPVKVGISIRYDFGNRWSVQTGVTCSYLSSERSNPYAYKTEQTLCYMGLPVATSYRLWENRRMRAYLTAGGEVERLVSGKKTTKYLTEEKSVSENVREHRPQFSLNVAAGFEYKISNTASLYIEPGISRYLNNGSDVDNIYKKHPTNFNLNMGLRFDTH